MIGKNLVELRMVIKPILKSGDSVGDFVKKNISLVWQNFPKFPFIVWECAGVSDHIIFCYKFGVEKKFSI